MKKILLSVFAVIGLVISTTAQNQSKFWFLDTKSVNFSSGSPVASSLPPALSGGGGQFAENGYYDTQNNNPVVYVRDNSVYKGNGTFVGIIGNTTAPLSFCSPWFPLQGMGTEVSIVPVPGSCSIYYIIYNSFESCLSSFGLDVVPILCYSIFDEITGTLTAVDVHISAPTTSEINYFGGIAVGKLRSNNTMFLYSAGGGNFGTFSSVNKYLITSTGITPANVPMLTFNNDNGSNVELDLSHDGSMLAWGNGSGSANKDVTVLYLDANGDWTGTIWQPSINASAKFTGVEFSPDNTKLYVGATGIGIFQLDVVGQTVSPTPIATIPSTYGASQLETSYDPSGNYKILVASSSSVIGAITNPNAPANSILFTANFIPSITSPTLIQNTFYSNVGSMPTVFNLPDQIDGQDYSALYTTYTQQCCLTTNTFTADTYTATISSQFPSTTQTWTPINNPFGNVATVTIRNSLIIPAGFNITIQGMTFKFAPRTFFTPTVAGAHVEVKRATSSTGAGIGGKLILDNTVFTSYDNCGNGMWEGIWVEGHGAGFNVAQGTYANSKMGWFIVGNQGRVENAYRGAVTARLTNPLIAPPTIPSYAAGTEGGVIIGSQGRFRNNQIGVMLLNYDFPAAAIDNNVSAFFDSFFETTLALNDPNVRPFAQAYLWGVKGISFKGNDFITNTSTTPYNLINNTSGIGIYSVNSRFTATANTQVSPVDKNIFTNLTYGIAAANIFSTKTVVIDQSDFINNGKGILLHGVNRATITQNNFQVFPSQSVPFPGDAYGIYLNYSRAFKVEENDFTYGSGSTPATSFGVIVNQSNPQRFCGLYDEIYKNTFHNILVGSQTQGNNSEKPFSGCYPSSPLTPNNIGLVFKCNRFYNNIDRYSIRVANFGNVFGNIAYQQGACVSPTSPANDRYSHTCPVFFTDGDYAIQGSFSNANPNAISYTYSSANLTEPLVPTCYTLPAANTGVNIAPCAAFTFGATTSCPSQLTPCLNCNRIGITSTQHQIDSANAVLATGNAPSLYQIIASNASPGQIKNALLAPGPYLSDSVIIAAINKNLPPGHIKQIIVANSPITQPVKDVLNTKTLPAGIKNEINNAQTGTSARRNLEDKISYLIGQKTFQVDGLLRVSLNDTLLTNGVDSVIAILKEFNIPEGKCELTKAFLDKQDFARAQQTVDTIRQTTNEFDNFCKLAQVLIDLEGVDKARKGLPSDTARAEEVSKVAKDTLSRESAGAQKLLEVAFGLIFTEYIEPLSPQQSLRLQTENNEPEPFVDDMMQGRIHPNPTNGTLNINYTFAENEQAVFELYNLLGKKQFTSVLQSGKNIFDISEQQLPEGIYFYRLVSNNKIVQHGKIAVIKK